MLCFRTQVALPFHGSCFQKEKGVSRSQLTETYASFGCLHWVEYQYNSMLVLRLNDNIYVWMLRYSWQRGGHPHLQIKGKEVVGRWIEEGCSTKRAGRGECEGAMVAISTGCRTWWMRGGGAAGCSGLHWVSVMVDEGRRSDAMGMLGDPPRRHGNYTDQWTRGRKVRLVGGKKEEEVETWFVPPSITTEVRETRGELAECREKPRGQPLNWGLSHVSAIVGYRILSFSSTLEWHDLPNSCIRLS